MKRFELSNNELKQLLKVISLGIGFWGLSLLWPDVNRVLTPITMMISIAGLAIASLIYILFPGSHHHHHNGKRNKDQASSAKLMRLNNHPSLFSGSGQRRPR